MNRDVDPIIERLTATIPGVRIEQLKMKHPGADDDGLWFISIPDRVGVVQIESSDGICPFIIESNFNNERFNGRTVEEVVRQSSGSFRCCNRCSGRVTVYPEVTQFWCIPGSLPDRGRSGQNSVNERIGLYPSNEGRLTLY